jgi:hypothetical protein
MPLNALLQAKMVCFCCHKMVMTIGGQGRLGMWN